jgi:hypothetical protein
MASPVAASTVRSYVLVGFIFYCLGAVAWSVSLLGTALFFIPVGGPPFGPAVFFPFFFPIGFFAALTIGFAWWSWLTLRNVEEGRYAEARTPSLLLGVFGLFLAWLVGGIFLLLAYAKLGEILAPAPPSVMGSPLRVCLSCGRAVAPNAKFCPHCGKPLPD